MKNLIILMLLLLPFVSYSSSVTEKPKKEKEKEIVAEKTEIILAGKTFGSICEGENFTIIRFFDKNKTEAYLESGEYTEAGRTDISAIADYKIKGTEIILEKGKTKYVFKYLKSINDSVSQEVLNLVSISGESDEFFNAEECRKILRYEDFSEFNDYDDSCKREASKNALLKFVCNPGKNTYAAAFVYIGKKDLSYTDIPVDFSYKLRELIENSNIFAFNLVKEIVSKNIMPNYRIMNFATDVRGMMLRDFDFFLKNINGLDNEAIKRLFVDHFQRSYWRDYEFYSAILNKTDKVKEKNLLKNANKIKAIVLDELNDEKFVKTVDDIKKTRTLADKLCDNYRSSFKKFSDFISENIVDLKMRISAPLSNCNSIHYDFSYLFYNEYMKNILEENIPEMEQPLKSYLIVVKNDLNGLVNFKPLESDTRYHAFIREFFTNQDKFVGKFKIENTDSIKWTALDLALIIKSCRKEHEYQTARYNIGKMLKNEEKQKFEELFSEIDRILKTEEFVIKGNFCEKFESDTLKKFSPGP